jgi:hypothetical protein
MKYRGWINLTRVWDKRLAPGNTSWNIGFYQTQEIFFVSWKITSFTERTLLRGDSYTVLDFSLFFRFSFVLGYLKVLCAFLSLLSYQLSFTSCLHIPSSFSTKQYRMSPTLASSCVVNFMGGVIDAWRRQWPIFLFPVGLLDHTVLDIQPAKSDIINSRWPADWTTRDVPCEKQNYEEMHA